MYRDANCEKCTNCPFLYNGEYCLVKEEYLDKEKQYEVEVNRVYEEQ